MQRLIGLIGLILLFSNAGVSQYSNQLTPQISSDNSISERIAYTKIAIQYGSPKVRGRVIWGEMEEYDQIWRAGANLATTISFSEDVMVEGQSLKQGRYALFVIPRKEKDWTIIFNNVADQWGAFNYDEEQDALRIAVPLMVNPHVEDLTFDIVAKEFEGAFVTLEWEKIKLSFFVEVQHYQILERMLKEELDLVPAHTQWVIYLQAANYLIDENARLDLAEKWLKESERLYPVSGEWSGQYYPKAYIYGDLLWAKAKLAALRGSFEKAINYAEEMMALEGDYPFYDNEKDSEQIDLRINHWKAQE
ncbi:DUF2911 domain-containing protein [Portibacter marinus]|uniref:DUF2911 domain-containing protein n=1 Tax=Portibacter marinus TaxID=2898660 RepID=UPI001F158E05|nr:DUF2911 domain-containing protein [Portibacter marinus]